MSGKKVELLAPAGSWDSLIAAVSAGADAVYFGGKGFNARYSAQNFDDPALIWAIEYCQRRRVKAYVTANTLVADRELPDFGRYIELIYQAGADAVIVQDLGVLAWIRRNLPKIPIHASTQMTIHTAAGANFLHGLGVKRAVLARELSLREIRDICRNSGLGAEVFIHGAMCASYSGQCLLSAFMGGRSANRGRCAQPCRLEYRDEKRSGTILSMKDMSYIKHVDKLRDAGVVSFKIEGRMKGPQYVSTVVRMYRKAIDGEKITNADMETLHKAFDRGGFTDHYLNGERTTDVFALSKPESPYPERENDKLPELLETDRVRKRPAVKMVVPKTRNVPIEKFEYTAEISNLEQLPPLIKSGIEQIYIPVDILDKSLAKYSDRIVCLQKCLDTAPLPVDFLRILGIKGISVGNLGQINEAKDAGFELYGEHTLNVFNRLSVATFKSLGFQRITLSSELMAAQIRDMTKSIPVEVIAYGRIPLMSMAVPPKKLLKDRMRVKFPVMGNQILNSRPIYMADKIDDLKNAGVTGARLVFTTEQAEEVAEVIRAYKSGSTPPRSFTRGKFYAGV